MEQQLVIFELANEQFGIHIADVESIVKHQPITTMPQAPSFVEGVTNLRGKILPVINLRKRLGLPVVEATKETRIVVVTLAGAQTGVIVDAVSEVLTISDDAVELPPAITTTIESTYIQGIAKIRVADGQSRLVILLDLPHILNPDEQLALQLA